jgi:hypothetical protein
MSWLRSGDRRYYYRCRRRNGVPCGEYIGAAGSPAAELAIAADAKRRLDREIESRGRLAEQHCLQGVTEPLLALCQVTDVLTHAVLFASNFHQHARGQWRLRREQQTPSR